MKPSLKMAPAKSTATRSAASASTCRETPLGSVGASVCVAGGQSSQARGQWAESVVERQMVNLGQKLVFKNLRTPFAELDLVFATDELGGRAGARTPVWTVVEVKTLGPQSSATGFWRQTRLSRPQYQRQARAIEWLRSVHRVDVEWCLALVTRDGKVEWIRDFHG